MIAMISHFGASRQLHRLAKLLAPLLFCVLILNSCSIYRGFKADSSRSTAPTRSPEYMRPMVPTPNEIIDTQPIVKRNIAVINLEAIGVSQMDALALTNRLRNELFNSGKFKVVERGMMESILAEQDFQTTGCTSDECLVELGQILGAEEMIGGSISRVGVMYSISVRRVDVATGELITVADYDIRGGIEEILTAGLSQVALMLAGNQVNSNRGNSSESQSVAAPEIILVGTVEQTKRDGYLLLSGIVENVGGRRADFVKVVFDFRLDWAGNMKTLTAYIKGNLREFEGGGTDDSSLLPGSKGTFELFVPNSFGSFIGFSYTVEREIY